MCFSLWNRDVQCCKSDYIKSNFKSKLSGCMGHPCVHSELCSYRRVLSWKIFEPQNYANVEDLR